MKTFKHPNLEDFVCPVCGGNEDEPIVLIQIDGTKDGNIAQARQYHVRCIDLLEVTGRDGKIFLHQTVTD